MQYCTCSLIDRVLAMCGWQGGRMSLDDLEGHVIICGAEAAFLPFAEQLRKCGPASLLLLCHLLLCHPLLCPLLLRLLRLHLHHLACPCAGSATAQAMPTQAILQAIHKPPPPSLSIMPGSYA